MKLRRMVVSIAVVAIYTVSSLLMAQSATTVVFGYKNFSKEAAFEDKFLAVPSAKLAGEELKVLTAEPHLAATPEDYKTAEYVAQKFKAAGLETEIIPYRVLLNQPKVVKVEAFGANGKKLMSGPTREHVEGDAFQEDARVVMPFNGSSGSGDVTGDVVYANYGRLEDFNQLAAMHIDLHGKIVLVRYGANFRGVKVYLAEQRGAVGVLIYSDPRDDGYFNGDMYPHGPWRPETGVQRGSVQYLFKYPGDPETPGIASTMDLPDSARAASDGNQPHIISIPISYHDAAPILEALKGPGTPEGWQGGLPFHYHVGPGGVRVHLVSEQDYQRRVIWNVIGKIRGAEFPNEVVIAGNHRDAWVYGAVDPNSGTAAMLETVHGVGELLKQGWRPKRSIIFSSWDAEEEGLIGSTEWVEQNMPMMDHIVAYFNMDVGVSGPVFSASAVPSLKQFIRELTKAVPSPKGATVYEQWKGAHASKEIHRGTDTATEQDVHIGDLGSGSDFTPFLQHAGVPSSDIGSDGPYGVYHSVFDNYAWYVQNADSQFLYLQEMARVFGLEVLRMANADVLPYDYVTYANAITAYIEIESRKAAEMGQGSLDFASAHAAAARFANAAKAVHDRQIAANGDTEKLNQILRATETALLTQTGLPNRSWFRHVIYAPGEYTGYAAVALPGVSEAVDAKKTDTAKEQLVILTQALQHAAEVLEKAR